MTGFRRKRVAYKKIGMKNKFDEIKNNERVVVAASAAHVWD